MLSVTRLQQRIARLQGQLLELGSLHPGSITEQYNVCGQPRCRCKDPKKPQKHGPYYQLSFTWRGYRLGVFPILVPPLRERPEDIPLLARHFALKHARLLDRRIELIPPDAVEALVRYPWPGNVRELENVIERAVILSPGPALRLPLSELRPPAGSAPAPSATLESAERKQILSVLNQTNWVIAGPQGAAARLGLERSSLYSKMRKLAIKRPRPSSS